MFSFFSSFSFPSFNNKYLLNSFVIQIQEINKRGGEGGRKVVQDKWCNLQFNTFQMNSFTTILRRNFNFNFLSKFITISFTMRFLWRQESCVCTLNIQFFSLSLSSPFSNHSTENLKYKQH